MGMFCGFVNKMLSEGRSSSAELSTRNPAVVKKCEHQDLPKLLCPCNNIETEMSSKQQITGHHPQWGCQAACHSVELN